MHKNWMIEQWNKVLSIGESKSNMMVYVRRRVSEKPATPCIKLTIKHGGGSVMCVCVCVCVCVCRWGLFPIAKSGICTRWKVNWTRLAITAFCSITQSHVERGLWVKDFYSCKIMTQCILVNSARSTLKAKRNVLHNALVAGAIRGLKSHWTGVEWIWAKSQS